MRITMLIVRCFVILFSCLLLLNPKLQAAEVSNFQPELAQLQKTEVPTHFILSGYLRKSMTVRIYPTVMSHLGIEGQFLPYELPLKEGKIDREQLERFLEVFRENPYLQSIVVSDPFKQVILEYLDDLTESAARIQTVNLVCKKDGKLLGDNIEAEAFLMGAQEEIDFEYEGHDMLFFGCGGVCSAIASHLAPQLARVGLIDIDPEKSQRLASLLKSLYPSITVIVFDRNGPLDFSDFDIFYNGTGLGKFSCDPQSIARSPLLEEDILPTKGLAIDANYTPWQTLFLEQMSAQGSSTLNGFSHMLSSTALHLSKISNKLIPYSELKSHVKNESL